MAASSFALACFIYGCAFALLAPYFMMPLILPVAIGMGLAIWSLPEQRTAVVRGFAPLLFAFLTVLAVWPVYLALALPGLPWITATRLFGAPLLLLTLIAYSSSRDFRNRISIIAKANPVLIRGLILFVCLQAGSIVLSKAPGASIEKFFNAQYSWTNIFLVSCIVFSAPGASRRFAKLLWATAVILSLNGILESRLHHVWWADHIPSFLKVNDFDAPLMGFTRAFSGVYRVVGTSTTSIGFAEYLALCAPFVLYFSDRQERRSVRVAAVATIPLLVYAISLSDTRSGMLAVFLTVLGSGLIWAIRQWRLRPGSFIGIGVVLSYPVFFVGAVVASFAVHRVKLKIWGGGAQQASSNARLDQIHQGVPLILKNPFGYGIGQSGGVLDYHSPDGFVTIDNYYLSLALDYGLIGLTIYVGLILFGIYKASVIGLKTIKNDGENRFFFPICLSMFSFLVIKSVFSQQDNHPLIFSMLGVLTAQLTRVRAENTDLV